MVGLGSATFKLYGKKEIEPPWPGLFIGAPRSRLCLRRLCWDYLRVSPESVPRQPKDGWNLLKGLPWSRSKRKVMYQSDGWIVNLFSGDERTAEAMRMSRMKSSFWNTALEGNDVLVNVDVTGSRAFDLRQQASVFRVLCWAALNGKIKAIGADPLVTPFQDYRETLLMLVWP